MATFKYRGLFRMRIQAYLTAFVVNVKRMGCSSELAAFFNPHDHISISKLTSSQKQNFCRALPKATISLD
ncbi:hypothetical protein FHS15_003499 [Paenibacillus castaneae]|nr:hypothetical protein [Paenibacillus castaneae]